MHLSKGKNILVTAATVNPDSRVSSQCSADHFQGETLRVWRYPSQLESVQFCRCTLCLYVARITIRTLHPFEVVQYESQSSLVGSRAHEFKLTRLWATCAASRLVPASFVDPRWRRWSVLRVWLNGWTVPSRCVRPPCLSILVHWALVGTVEIYVETCRSSYKVARWS